MHNEGGCFELIDGKRVKIDQARREELFNTKPVKTKKSGKATPSDPAGEEGVTTTDEDS